MSKQQHPLVRGDLCRVNVGDSVYFGAGRRSWVYATIDTVHISGNSRRYDATVVARLRGGLGMAAKRFGGNALGRGAQGALSWAGKGGMRGGALDMAGSMAGGAMGNALQGG